VAEDVAAEAEGAIKSAAIAEEVASDTAGVALEMAAAVAMWRAVTDTKVAAAAAEAAEAVAATAAMELEVATKATTQQHSNSVAWASFRHHPHTGRRGKLPRAISHIR
jgi:hypothetical protein